MSDVQNQPPRNPEADAARDQMSGAQLIACCNAALRVLALHDTTNDAVTKPIQSLVRTLETLQERHPRIVLAAVEGVFYVGDGRVRLSSAQQPLADQLLQEFDQRTIGGFAFDGARPADELVAFFQVLNKNREGQDVNDLRRTLKAAGVAGITVSKVLRPVTESLATKTVQSHAADVYSAAIRHVAQLLYTKAAQSTARSKRIVHELVDLAERDPQMLLALAGLRGTGSEEGEHAVAVGALSIGLGWRLGLDRGHLADLGLAALHHDMGLIALGERNSRDVDRHPIVALKGFLDVIAPSESLLRQIIAGFEHHRDVGGGGRPALSGVPTPHFFSQIIRLANDFDGLTRGRRARSPLDVADALAQMTKAAATVYQPALLRLFVDMVGGVETEVPAEAPVEAPVAAAPAYNDLDMLLADFVGKKPDAEPRAVNSAEPPKPGAPKKTALGAMKLKKIAKKKP